MKHSILFLLIFAISTFGFAQKKSKVFISNNIKIDMDTVSTFRGVIKDQDQKIEEKIGDIGETVYLFILNKDYDNWQDLQWPIIDGNKFEKLLNESYKVNSAKSIKLVNASRSQIFDAFYGIMKNLTENTNFLVFYAGHGYYNQNMEEGYWIPKDGDLENPSNWISNDDLKRIIKSVKSKRCLVLADACFSGSLSRGTPKTTNEKVDFDYQLSPNQLNQRIILNSRKVMTSGAMQQVPDKSAFMESIINTLKNNTFKYFTSQQLYDRIKRNVTDQIPIFSHIPNSGSEIGGDFIFERKF